MFLPKIGAAKSVNFLSPKNCLLITSGGFEKRSIAWAKSLPKSKIFEEIILFKHEPERESKIEEQTRELQIRSSTKVIIEAFNRYEPVATERAVQHIVSERLSQYRQIFVEISVMSKLLIVQLSIILSTYKGEVVFIYAEPKTYSPSEKEYKASKTDASMAASFPTSGVLDVIRTPLLSSFSAQQKTVLIVAFTSFNEQLIRALASSITATHMILLNGIPPTLAWRSKATQELHTSLIEEYIEDNPLDNHGNLVRRTSTLDYSETIRELVDIYSQNYTTKRIILAPTGSKMQALSCGILKSCCPDLHIEYPTPESFYVKNFSSSEIREVHALVFKSYSERISKLSKSIDRKVFRTAQ